MSGDRLWRWSVCKDDWMAMVFFKAPLISMFLIVFQPINHHNWFFYSLTIDIGGLFNCFHKSRFLLQFWSFNSFCWLNSFGATIEWLRTIVEDTMTICLSYSLLLHYIFGSWIMGAPSHLAFVSILLASVQRYNVTPSCMTYTLTQYLQQWYVTILLAHHWSSTPRLNHDVSFRTLFSNFGQLTTGQQMPISNFKASALFIEKVTCIQRGQTLTKDG